MSGNLPPPPARAAGVALSRPTVSGKGTPQLPSAGLTRKSMRVNTPLSLSLFLLLASKDAFIQIQLEEGRRAGWYSPWQGSSSVESWKEGDGRKDGRTPGRQSSYSLRDSSL